MNSEAPAYYSRLAPFSQWFEQGQPILMYHKLGPRPGRVRLKGLYVSRRLFAQQLRELQQAGFSSGRLEACRGPNLEKRVMLTFDDGYQNVLRHGLEPLTQTRFQAMTFLVADRLGQHNDWDVGVGEAPELLMDRVQVQEWLAAGHDIGSHTLTHPFLTHLPRAQAQEEISASRKKLEDLFGRPIEHFCYPYGDWNPSVRDLVQEAGYKTACTTLAGLNGPADSLFVLKRLLVRYPSRNLKAIWARMRARFS